LPVDVRSRIQFSSLMERQSGVQPVLVFSWRHTGAQMDASTGAADRCI